MLKFDYYFYISIGGTFMISKLFVVIGLLMGSFFLKGVDASAKDDEKVKRVKCPVGLVTGMSLDKEFGAGTSKITQCIRKIPKIKAVFELNRTCADQACTRAYGLINLRKSIKDYEVTHGLKSGVDFELVAIMLGNGNTLSINNDSATKHPRVNPFQAEVQALMKQGVKFFLCQNAARAGKIVKAHIIPGVHFVTAGVTALTDFQQRGFALIHP